MKKSNNNMETDTVRYADRLIRTIRLGADAGAKEAIPVHVSFRDGVFYAAMQRARFKGKDRTFASGFYYTGAASELCSEEDDAKEWIWMPVETEEDERYLFSVNPWKESGMRPAQQRQIAKELKASFEAFRKEMLSGTDGV